MLKHLLSALFTVVLLTGLSILKAQNSSLKPYGNIRFAHLGNSESADGLGGDNTSVRIRIGVSYEFSESHMFRARLAGTLSKDLDQLNFTILSDGGRLNYNSFSFDEFYYQYQMEGTLLKLGRFQQSIPVLTNAKRSHFRFQSNANFIHWSDGLYLKHWVNDEWFGEAVVEYQPKDHLTYSYQGPLNFNQHDHNVTTYVGLENRTRDANNIIQKGFGLFVAPQAYLYDGSFKTYAAIMSRLVYDLPARDLLSGGSFRIGAEIGQNITSSFNEGTSMVLSAGINNVSEKHELMVEFAKTDAEWLTATAYGVNSDEIEIRYRYFISRSLNPDFRYRIRNSRISGQPTMFSTFLRATYSF